MNDLMDGYQQWVARLRAMYAMFERIGHPLPKSEYAPGYPERTGVTLPVGAVECKHGKRQ